MIMINYMSMLHPLVRCLTWFFTSAVASTITFCATVVIGWQSGHIAAVCDNFKDDSHMSERLDVAN